LCAKRVFWGKFERNKDITSSHTMYGEEGGEGDHEREEPGQVGYTCRGNATAVVVRSGLAHLSDHAQCL